MSNADFTTFVWQLLNVMKVSIVLPMMVVWLRKKHFSPAVTVLSWYVYLSAASAALAMLYPTYISDNSLIIIAFNAGKIALLGAVYSMVLDLDWLRRTVRVSTIVALLVCLGVTLQGLPTQLDLAVVLTRVIQCALLAAFALLHLEQALSRPGPTPPTRDPIWLLSVGQLLYSAGTVTAFSLDYLSTSWYEQSPKWLFISISGIIFNLFITLAFLWARRAQPVAAASAVETSKLAQA